MPIIYTLIARAPSSVLIDSTNPAHTGNFSDISKKILANIPQAQQADHQKVTFVFEGSVQCCAITVGCWPAAAGC